jgi:hypothetical protein
MHGPMRFPCQSGSNCDLPAQLGHVHFKGYQAPRRRSRCVLQRFPAQPVFVGDQDVGRGAFGAALPVDHFLDDERGRATGNQYRRIHGDVGGHAIVDHVAAPHAAS